MQVVLGDLALAVCGWSVHRCRRQLSGVGCLKQSELCLGHPIGDGMHHDTAQLFIVSSALVLPVEM